MEGMNSISGNLVDGLSLYYAVMDNCAHSLGYLPDGKGLPSEDFELVDELHMEQVLAGEWLLGGGAAIRDRIVPEVIRLCGVFSGYHDCIQKGQDISDEALAKALHSLGNVIRRISEENDSLCGWIKKIDNLHDRAISKFQYNPDPDFYSWQDAAAKLELVSQYSGEIAISWDSVLQLVYKAADNLKKAQASSVQVIKDMFADAAARNWMNATDIAKKILEII